MRHVNNWKLEALNWNLVNYEWKMLFFRKLGLEINNQITIKLTDQSSLYLHPRLKLTIKIYAPCRFSFVYWVIWLMHLLWENVLSWKRLILITYYKVWINSTALFANSQYLIEKERIILTRFVTVAFRHSFISLHALFSTHHIAIVTIPNLLLVSIAESNFFIWLMIEALLYVVGVM